LLHRSADNLSFSSKEERKFRTFLSELSKILFIGNRLFLDQSIPVEETTRETISMMGRGQGQSNPQAAMSQRPKPEDAAGHITVSLDFILFYFHAEMATKNLLN